MWLNGSLYVWQRAAHGKFTDTDSDGVADKEEIWFDGKTLTDCREDDLHGPYLGRMAGFTGRGAFAKQSTP
ncbi:MAG: hypothetical protein U0792_03905 [Gemmataceae bacterium]